MFLDILVGIDGSPSAHLALDTAAELARAGNAKLTIIAVAPPVSSYVTLAGVDVGRMRSELDRWASELLEKATATLPDDVIAHTVQRAGEASTGATTCSSSARADAGVRSRGCSGASTATSISTRTSRC
jgi:nucleotide-binding universal stress UspA family protein